MPEYKEFSKEEEELYDREMNELLRLVKEGATIPDACRKIKTENPEMIQILKDDLLKIMIAELHYGKKMPLNELARKLDVKMSEIMRANEIMIEDVMHTVKETHLKNFPGSDLTH